MKTQTAILGAAILAASCALAQEREAAEKKRKIEIMLDAGKGAAGETHAFTFSGSTFEFVTGELLNGKVVKGAPYSAEAVTETVQVLGDGNRIVRRSSAMMYRDGEGRERREQSLGAIGPWQAKGEPEQTIFISDPVARINYTLNPARRTAQKLPLLSIFTKSVEGAISTEVHDQVFYRQEITPRHGGVAGVTVIQGGGFSARVGEKKESLGKMMIDGVEAEGTRSTVTIPAGEMGNERPIEIVGERWYSPELQMVVMSKHSDPRTGENTYKLTRVNRTEPLRSLFEVPGDYTLQEGPEKMRKALEKSRKDEIF